MKLYLIEILKRVPKGNVKNLAGEGWQYQTRPEPVTRFTETKPKSDLKITRFDMNWTRHDPKLEFRF